MANIDNKYDSIGEFHQGVAIVVKNGKYGAILMGGKEILPPVYDMLTEFKDGFATAAFNGEERLVNMSGQIQVLKGENAVFLPEAFEWGFDYTGKFFVVKKGGKYGVIDINYETHIDFIYDSYYGFHNGCVIFGNTKREVVYDDNFHKRFYIENTIDNNTYVVSDPNNNKKLVGLSNNQWNLIIPMEYKTIEPIQENFYLISDDKGRKGLVDSTGTTIVKLFFQEIEIINNSFILSKQNIYVDDYTTNHEYTVFNANGDVLLKYEQKQGRYNEYLKFDSRNDESIFIRKDKETFRLNCKGEFFLIGQDSNTEIQVSPEYIHYSHKSISDTISIIEKNDMYGLSDHLGKILIPVQYIFIQYWKRDLLIAAKIKEDDNEDFLLWGIIDFSNKCILPFIYSRLRIINSYFCAFSYNLPIKRMPEKYSVKFYVPGEEQPSYVNWIDWNNYHRSIHWHLERSDYYEYHIREIINWGLISSEPKEIFLPIFDYVETYISGNNDTQQNPLTHYSNGQSFTLKSSCKSPIEDNNNLQVSHNNETTTVNDNGEFVLITREGKEVLIPSSRFDWCVNFGDLNYTKVIKHGLEGKINTDGKLISLNGDSPLTVPQKFDWAYDFSYGYVPVLVGERWGIADADFHLVVPNKYAETKVLSNTFFLVRIENKYGVVNSENEIVVGIDYDNIEFNNEIFVVRKNGKEGCVNALNTIIIPPIYDKVFPLNNKFFKVKNDDIYGIVNTKHEIVLSPEYNDIQLWGVVDTNNNTIPIDADEGYNGNYSTLFIIEKQEGSNESRLKGLADSEGHILLPAIFHSIELFNELLPSLYLKVSKKEERSFQNSDVIATYKIGDDAENLVFWDSIIYEDGMFSCKKDGLSNLFSKHGEILLNWRNTTFVVPSSFSLACNSEIGLFRVLRNGKWGILNLQKQMIVPNKYALIGEFHDSYAIVGMGDGFIFSNNLPKADKDIKYGLIDITGEEVIPTDNDSIRFFDNGYIGFKKDGLWGLMSASLSLVVAPAYSSMYLFDNLHFVISNSNGEKGLIDCCGNTIIPLQHFDNIEISEDGYLKVTHNGYLQSRCKLYNAQGKVVLGDDDSYEEITYKGNGLNLVRKSEWYDYRDDAYYHVYNLCAANGKEILPYFCKEIHFIENGNLSIKGDKGWGIADIMGNIIIEPNYEEELKFENGTSNITVRGSSSIHTISLNGDVYIVNGNKNIKLPKEFYWGTEFVNGLSIVRSLKENDKVGVVNQKGKMIIPAVYDKISIMSNDCIFVVDGICLGIADMKGRFIFPPIFSCFKYLTEDRIWVKWNVKVAMSWCNNGSFVSGDGEYTKSHNYPRQFDRVALCDSNGNILNDKEIVYISKFENGYAKAYKDIFVDEKGVVRLTQAGIIDINGSIVLEPKYKRIDFHNESYVLAKDNHYSIFRLSDKKLTCFEGNDISHIWSINSFGMAEYTSTGKYISKESSWDGDRGVLGIDGIIVPAGKYDYVEILDKGMILVANKPIVFSYEQFIPLSIGFDDDDDYKIESRKKQWYEEWGVLLSDGKEIVPCCYSYIYNHPDDKIILCQGGNVSYNKYKGRIEVENGKWSVLDIYTHKVIETNTQEEAWKFEIKPKPTENQSINKERGSSVFENPKVLLTDCIEKRKNRVSDDYFQYDDGDGPYSKYGGYNGWDDNTIDEAFDGNPELTWNID